LKGYQTNRRARVTSCEGPYIYGSIGGDLHYLLYQGGSSGQSCWLQAGASGRRTSAVIGCSYGIADMESSVPPIAAVPAR